MAGEAVRDEKGRVFGAWRGLESVKDLNLNMALLAVEKKELGSCWHLFKHLGGDQKRDEIDL